MRVIKKFDILLLLTIVQLTCLVPRLFGGIIEEREYRGKMIVCVRSGLQGFNPPCGANMGYSYVFVGSVLSVTDLSDTEKQLRLMSEEVFFGDPSKTMAVKTNQGACLGDIQVGDRWLFYLQEDQKSKTLLLAYGSPSKSAVGADDDIVRLRRLADMSDAGMIKGSVSRTVWENNQVRRYDPVQNHKIVVKREKDGAEYDTYTDSKGNYEFEPLPIGRYDLNANTAQGLWTEGGTVEISPHSCFVHAFQLKFDGQISGQVTSASGEPIANVQVAVVPADDEESWFNSDITNKEGQFEVKGLRPGRYLIGIGIQSNHSSPEWRSRLYYPGVPTRDLAVVVEVGQVEQPSSIKITLPSR